MSDHAPRAAMDRSLDLILAFGAADARLDRLLARVGDPTRLSPPTAVLAPARETEVAQAPWGRAAGAVRELWPRARRRPHWGAAGSAGRRGSLMQKESVGQRRKVVRTGTHALNPVPFCAEP